jgi:DNA-directed RNA polymerase specialized sigma24 family protein
MLAKHRTTSVVIAVITAPPPKTRQCETPGEIALDFVTNERALIQRMISEFLGRQGKREADDVTQDLWVFLNGRLQRGIPLPVSRRAMLITMTRNYLRNLARGWRAWKRRPRSLQSLNSPAPDVRGQRNHLEDLVSQRDLDARRGRHPSTEQATEWRLDLAGAAAKLPARQRSFFERLRSMSVPEAAIAEGIGVSTGYRWRLSLRERFQGLLGPHVSLAGRP